MLALLGGVLMAPAFAHTTVNIEEYAIEAGWGIEPPVAEFRNEFVFEVSTSGGAEGVKSGVKNAFKDLVVTAKFGGITKRLDINSEPTPGHYSSKVIPTKTGSISILMSGSINGTPVDIEIPVEDVETTAVLDFPPRAGSAAGDTQAVKSALSALQEDVRALKSDPAGADSGVAYDYAVFGLSLGAAGVILAIVAMLRRS